MNEFISVAEASGISGFSPHYIRRLFNEGRIEGESIDGHYYIKRSSLYDFLRKRRPISNRLQNVPKCIAAIPNKMQKNIPGNPNSDTNNILEIEDRFHGDLLVYMSLFGKENSIIVPDDGVIVDDFLNGMEARFPGKKKKFEKIILYLSSPGGILEASVKVVDIIRQYAESFEVIVPYMAKSAASLICLSADMIHMTTISELGPIDPIIENPTKPGQMIPARAIDDFIKYYSSVADSQGPLANSLSKIFENKIDPYLLGSWKYSLSYSQREIEESINGKIDKENIPNIINIFTTDNISHSHPITYKNLYDIGLRNIEQIIGDKLNYVKKAYTDFSNYMTINRLVKIIGNRHHCFNIQEVIQNDKM